MSDAAFDLTEAHRRVSNMVRFGTIAPGADGGAVFDDQGRVRVQIEAAGDDNPDGWITDWLNMVQLQAGRVRTWSPPIVGEQVAILSPSGETGAAVVLRGLSRDSFPLPSMDADLVVLMLCDDGGSDQYDLAGHVRTLSVPAGGQIILSVAGGPTVTLSDSQALITLGGSTVTIKDGEVDVVTTTVKLTGDTVELAGGGHAVARVGDSVDLHTGLITTGSAKVTSG